MQIPVNYAKYKPEESRLDKFMRWLMNVPDTKNLHPSTPPTIDEQYTDAAQLRTWRQERG